MLKTKPLIGVNYFDSSEGEIKSNEVVQNTLAEIRKKLLNISAEKNINAHEAISIKELFKAVRFTAFEICVLLLSKGEIEKSTSRLKRISNTNPDAKLILENLLPRYISLNEEKTLIREMENEWKDGYSVLFDIVKKYLSSKGNIKEIIIELEKIDPSSKLTYGCAQCFLAQITKNYNYYKNIEAEHGIWYYVGKYKIADNKNTEKVITEREETQRLKLQFEGSSAENVLGSDFYTVEPSHEMLEILLEGEKKGFSKQLVYSLSLSTMNLFT